MLVDYIILVPCIMNKFGLEVHTDTVRISLGITESDHEWYIDSVYDPCHRTISTLQMISSLSMHKIQFFVPPILQNCKNRTVNYVSFLCQESKVSPPKYITLCNGMFHQNFFHFHQPPPKLVWRCHCIYKTILNNFCKSTGNAIKTNIHWGLELD